MHRIACTFLALTSAWAFGLFGCTSAPARGGADDYRGALLAAITTIEGAHNPRSPAAPPSVVVLVISSATPPELRRACVSLRQTISDYDLPGLDTFELPPGHLQPESLVITGDTGVFRGLLGPVPRPGTSAGRNACGTRHEVDLVRQPDGTWRSAGRRVQHCRLAAPRPPARAA
jgi:hypothetical protein